MNAGLRANPGALLLLRGNDSLQLMIATWPNVDRSLGGETFDPDNRRHAKAVSKRWAELTGLRYIEVLGLWPQAFANRMCRADGTVDDLARSYVATLGVALLPREMRPAPRKPEPKKEA